MGIARPGWRQEAGFTLIELMVATVMTVIVVGGAVALSSQVQNSYRRQMEMSAAEQEGRYALEFVGRYIRGAGNNPFNRVASECPADPTPFEAIRFDPDADGVDNDIRLQTDSNPPDGNFGGTTALGCTQANEDITVSFDAVNNTIVFFDNNLGGALSTRTDRVIGDLRFIYRDSAHNITAIAADVVYVETQVTVQTRTADPGTGVPVSRTLSSEIRVRSR